MMMTQYKGIQRKRSVVNGLFGLCLLGLLTIRAQSQSLTGPQIFERMKRVYADVITYQDSGRVVITVYEPGWRIPKFTDVKVFSTAYSKPENRFRFGYRKLNAGNSVQDEMVVWSRQAETYLWWTIRQSTSREESLTSALAAATGVSGTASRKIPGLLLPKRIEAGWGIESLQNIQFIGTDVVDKTSCYRIKGIYRKNKVAFLWIDQKTFLVRRVDEGTRTNQRTVRSSITYYPRLNQPIPLQALLFQQPGMRN